MASGTIPVSFPALKSRYSGLSYSKSVDFKNIAYVPGHSHRSKSLMIKRLSATNTSNSDSEWEWEWDSDSDSYPDPDSESDIERLCFPDWPHGLPQWTFPKPQPAQKQYYCESPYKTVRRKTRTVMVGNVALGSDHPIKVQTMTTSDTKNVAQTVEEIMRIADRGADLVRITVHGDREADACFDIKNTLVQKNYNIPLVADVHFTPSVALRVAECFDQICVNSGNFADIQHQFRIIYYDDYFNLAREQLWKVFLPLLEKCKKYGRALDIRAIHGNLSDLKTSYYGDTPKGMVDSAVEFALFCRVLDHHNFVFSMKASNPVIMVQAYRLLASKMYMDGWDYPLHLEVADVGKGQDAKMKSAIIIGALLQDGLGDTIRVPLTEPPEEEIAHCRKLANLGMQASKLQKGVAPFDEKHRRFYSFDKGRRGQLPSQKEGDVVDYGGVLHRDGSVLMSISLHKLKTPELLYKSLAAKLIVGMPFKDMATVDSILLRELPPLEDVDSRLALKRLTDAGVGVLVPLSEQYAKQFPNAIALVNLRQLWTGAYMLMPEGTRLAVTLRGDESYEDLSILKAVNNIIMLLHNLPYTEDKISRVHAARRLFEYLGDKALDFPVIHHLQYPEGTNIDDLVIDAGSNVGALLVDRLGDGLMLEAPGQDFDFLRITSFSLLQGCRMRNPKAEYVSCPSCSCATFDLQKVSAEIRDKTSHLPGVSIGIMGCLENGIDETVDVHFQYIGSTVENVCLYVEKKGVKWGVPVDQGIDALIQLIKDHGRWVDPPVEE